MAKDFEKTIDLYRSIATHYAREATTFVNLKCETFEAWQIIAITFGVTYVLLWIRSQFNREIPLTQMIRKKLFRLARKLPFVQAKIAKDMASIETDIHNDIHKMDKIKKFYTTLPAKGMSAAEVIKEAKSYDKMGQVPYKEGKVSGQVYCDFPPELMKLQSTIFDMFSYTNPLHPDVFPAVRKMEAELVRMVCDMFNGSEDSCGTMTTGGTESILVALLAYRNLAYDRGIDKPEAVFPSTAHAAFWKACEYFRIRPRVCDVDEDMSCDMKSMEKMINKNTCCLVGSSPQFAHGTIDPLDKISALGIKYNVPVHVDACLGGLLLPNMEALGYDMPLFDFRLPGVTSISCDTHKYGFAPKGSSVCMYRTQEYLHHQYYALPEWSGGIYATPTLAGSRSGLNIALTWATMLYYGREGYRSATEKVITAARTIRKGCENIPGLRILGTSQVSVISFTSDLFNAYELMDLMHKRGWLLNATQYPTSFHVAVTMFMTRAGLAESFVSDIKECTAQLVKNPNPSTVSKTASMYGAAVSAPDASLVREFTAIFLDSCYSTKTKKTE